jgi:hypothetical protein
MTGMRALLVCLVAAVATLAATAESAHACSCVAPDPRVLLAQSDGAFVGRLVSSRRLGPGRRLLTFRVERRVKGAIGARVDVESPADSAGCGVSAPVGRRVGIFLDRHRGRWLSTLCRQVDPAALLGRKRAPAGLGTCPSA